MKRVGIIGAGQLGQMLGFAARNLDVECLFLDPGESPPAAAAGEVIRYDFDSEEGLAELARQTDLITYEFENVPVHALPKLPVGTIVYPPAAALEHAQDRIVEKTLFEQLGIPVPGFRPVDAPEDLAHAASELGLPIVLKTRRLGYDGKGQVVVREESAISGAVESLGGRDLIAEAWVPFDREVSAIGARSASGETAFYPLTQNEHRNGILSVSRAPAPDAGDLEKTATQYLERLLVHLDYVGVLALELFVTGDSLLANEFAPRVHNSGHWTIEGSETSQFENHMRAILDMPLGGTGMRGEAGMVNLIGEMPADLSDLTAPPCYLHDYGKAPRPGRKLGHVNVLTTARDDREEILEKLANKLNL